MFFSLSTPAAADPVVIAQSSEVPPDPAPGQNEPSGGPDSFAKRPRRRDDSPADPFQALRDPQPGDQSLAVHPLAAARPTEDVVICDGGCPDAESAVVFAEPKKRAPVQISELRPTAIEAAAVNKPEISCVAGCFDGPQSYPARKPILKPQAKAKATAAEPTAARSAKPDPGRWLTSAGQNTKSRATTASQGWMARITKEQDQRLPFNSLHEAITSDAQKP